MRKASFLSIALLCVLPVGVLTAQDDDKSQKRDRAGTKPAGQTDRPAAGQRPGRGNRPQIDPARVVARMLQEFDKDGDQKLDEQELTKLFVAMRERGGMMRGGMQGRDLEGRPGMRRSQERPEGGQARRGRRGGAESNERPGGDKPKRPATDR